MKRLFVVGALLICFVALPSSAHLGGATAMDVADAITELDVERARTLLSSIEVDSAPLALERARLSLYVGDCDAASATLATLSGVKEAAFLADLARSCARATAGSVVIEDRTRGLWIRLEDEADRALVPLLSDVAVRARDGVERDLGVVMPRPLRIDLVRDLFSLSAVSGLPLTSAETTGTVAVARWGRVNLISPRAATNGFPWEDTMAHEITHLALSRATRDRAPLWLQEGLAKRQEIRWRPPRPFDGDPPPDVIARDALLTGQSVGVDKLGLSIAMLPSADAASIAFAEVSSFVEYWVRVNGRPALRLLFSDLKGLGEKDADAALTSVSGYDLAGWIRRWQEYLKGLPPDRGPSSKDPDADAALLAALEDHAMPADGRDRARKLRVAELLFERGDPKSSSARLRAVFAADTRDAQVRWRLGRSLIADGKADAAAPLFRAPDALDSGRPGFFALEGRFQKARGDAAARASFDLGQGLDPYLEDAACDGEFRVPDATGQLLPAGEPEDPVRKVLCEAARNIQKE